MGVKKDYVGWYRLKARLEADETKSLFKEREVWWCSVGVNVGDEEDGKHKLFERPVLVLKKYSENLFVGVPLSSAKKSGRYYHDIKTQDGPGVVILSQVRTFSSKRLQRKMGGVSENAHASILTKYRSLFT